MYPAVENDDDDDDDDDIKSNDERIEEDGVGNAWGSAVCEVELFLFFPLFFFFGFLCLAMRRRTLTEKIEDEERNDVR